MWAQAVAQCQPALPSQPQIPTGSHTILIRMEEKEDKEKVKKSTNKEILQDLNHPGVIAVKKLESGDVRIFTVAKGVQETLSSDLAWVQKGVPSATPETTLYQVLVHGIRIEGFRAKEGETNTQIQEENGRLHPRLKVAQSTWMKSQRAREGKTHSSVILSVQSQS
jgi:hypothetical protein